ncbi:phage capsid protein [Listeria booriae]|uniref:Phage capsid protein n=1 Tax=Listeria booriae TaxID=1552123 RepID=A0A842CS56_9LIST|nr:phage capsid protein [Listeria booriae]MBC2004645.1 phage capsid protein [Listeria booriae]
MPVTLEQAKVAMNDAMDLTVIDEFRRASFLMDQLTFDDTVSPGTGGSNLVYGYQFLKTPAVAGFREINKEYEAQEADREDKSVKLKIFGGAFEIDRVIQSTSGQLNEAEFQMKQKIAAATNMFHYNVINGDEGKDSKMFNGLNKMLTGTSTEIGTKEVIDLTNIVQDKFMLLDALDEFLAELDGKPTMLMGNNKLITKIKGQARRAGYLTASEDAFGRKIESYDGIPLVDLGYFAKVDGNNVTTTSVVEIVDRTVDGTAMTGLTDLFAVNLGLDGFHGATPAGNGSGIRTFLPDFNTPGAVKKGEVEMVAGLVLKASRKAGVLRNIKVK